MRAANLLCGLALAAAWRGPQPRVKPLTLRRAAPAAPTPIAAAGNKVQKRLIALLSFNAGVADVVLFKKHGCFATMMTGNLIKGTCALVDAKWADARFFGCMILSYLAGCSGQRILDQRATPRTKSRVIALATFLLFRCSDVFGGASARRGALCQSDDDVVPLVNVIREEESVLAAIEHGAGLNGYLVDAADVALAAVVALVRSVYALISLAKLGASLAASSSPTGTPKPARGRPPSSDQSAPPRLTAAATRARCARSSRNRAAYFSALALPSLNDSKYSSAATAHAGSYSASTAR